LADDAISRELAHHEELYSGFAQQHFAKSAVRAFRRDLVRHVLKATGADSRSHVLSLGCGIGDTELLLAPHVASVTGVDISPSAIRQARADAERSVISNAHFLEGSVDHLSLEKPFNVVIGVFFLHHLPNDALRRAAERIHDWLAPGGVFWALDPNYYRLSGAIGKWIVPRLMRKYQTPDERELKPGAVADLFGSVGFETQSSCYDFTSSPIGGLFPAWGAGYRAARIADEVLIRVPLLRRLGSNFELRATRVK